jgi:hypothetical protein
MLDKSLYCCSQTCYASIITTVYFITLLINRYNDRLHPTLKQFRITKKHVWGCNNLATVMWWPTNLDSFTRRYNSHARTHVIPTAAYAVMLIQMMGMVMRETCRVFDRIFEIKTKISCISLDIFILLKYDARNHEPKI